jgi:hypothetical protein
MDIIDKIDLSPTITPETAHKKNASFLLMQDLFINSKDALFVGRLSGNEPLFCNQILKQQHIDKYLINNMLVVAGIQFRCNEDVVEYVKTYVNSFNHCNLIGVWNGGCMYKQTSEFYGFLKKIYNKLSPICATVFEIFYYMDLPEYQFHKVFENKKVLVVSSHLETIKLQLPKLNKLFKKPIFHSSTQFYVYKPPQQNAGSNDSQSWQFHFKKMQNEIKHIQSTEFDFDIALVSCGGFGMPISSYIHTELGKSVIYIGGALQLLFGIMGRRWESLPEINKHVNEHWIRPLPEDKPKNIEYCEGGCYW